LSSGVSADERRNKSDFQTYPGTRLTCIGAPKSDLVLDAYRELHAARLPLPALRRHSFG